MAYPTEPTVNMIMPPMLGRLCRHSIVDAVIGARAIAAVIELYSCDFVVQCGVSDVGSHHVAA